MALTRRPPTEGTADWSKMYISAFANTVTSQVTSKDRTQIFEQASIIQGALSAINRLRSLGRTEAVPGKRIMDDDKTAHVVFNVNWHQVAFDVFADRFGRFGLDTVSTVPEAACYSHALADAFGAERLFYRGEHKYGHPLKSRAERHLPHGIGEKPGITDQELAQLRRFQREVRRDRPLSREIRDKAWKLPHRNDPIWLPIMQHYDEDFGTRLLDISGSVYAGLYFACVGWNGEIDDSLDGLLYTLIRSRGGMRIRGSYFDRKTDEFDEDWDDVAPKSVANSFKDWKNPEVFRVYKSSSANPREAAQDGWFLVRGALTNDPQFGTGFKFRVPAEAKFDLTRQLWMAGYTPERIVRGPKGRAAHKTLRNRLGFKY